MNHSDHGIPSAASKQYRADPWRICSQAAGALVCLLGTLVLAGWAFEIPSLKSVLPGWVSMKANTALAFLLMGASLWFQCRSPRRNTAEEARSARQSSLARQWLAGGAVLIGLLTVVEYAFGWNLGIDQLLFQEDQSAVATFSPGRMALTTAICFACTGLALVLLDLRKHGFRHLTQFLVLPPAWIALLTLVGYMFNSQSLYRFGMFTAMAIHTTLGFLLLSAGILLARREYGLAAMLTDRGPGGMVVRRMLPAAFVMPVTVGWLRLQGERAGFFDSSVGVALVAVCYIAIFALLAWWVSVSVQRADQALQHEKNLFHAIIDNLPDLISLKDVEGRYILNNEAHLRSMGATQQEVVGKNTFDFHPAELARLYHEADMQIVRSGEPMLDKEEMALHSDTGERRWHLTGKLPLKDHRGTIIGIISLSHDITERKRAEQEIERVNRELLETSRQAAMAEVASGVLHNVGNVLNSVNVSAECVAVLLRHLKVDTLSKLVNLLREHEKDWDAFATKDPRGRQLPAFLAELAQHQAANQASVLQELTDLKKNIDHIKDIIMTQQTYAKLSGVTEVVQAGDLVLDALRLNANSLARNQIEVAQEFGPVLPLNVEKHRVLSIIDNLIRNAKHACNESGRADKRITVRTSSEQGRAAISIIDNGIGIPPENLPSIFKHGFTTKKTGHGFGLHYSQRIAREMGGALTVHSEGHGKGATFTLDLPLQP